MNLNFDHEKWKRESAKNPQLFGRIEALCLQLAIEWPHGVLSRQQLMAIINLEEFKILQKLTARLPAVVRPPYKHDTPLVIWSQLAAHRLGGQSL